MSAPHRSHYDDPAFFDKYLNGLLTAGFELVDVQEPQPPARLMDVPGMQDELRRPMMLIVSARKP